MINLHGRTAPPLLPRRFAEKYICGELVNDLSRPDTAGVNLGAALGVHCAGGKTRVLNWMGLQTFRPRMLLSMTYGLSS